MLKYIKVLRIHHWVKNLFIFIPAFFAGSLFRWDVMAEIAQGFIPLCLCASGIYVFNDLLDKPYDIHHPEKSKRPIASGDVSSKEAIALFLVLLIAGLSLAFFIKAKYFFLLSIYVAMNIAYSVKLKQIAILDIIIISIGFVIRIKCGGVLGMIGISQWLMIMIFLLALFLALGKRRDDLVLKSATGKPLRKASNGYQVDFLNVLIAMISAIIIMAYLMYCMSPETMKRFGTYRLYYTGLFVLAGLLRYLQIIFVLNDSGSPVKQLYKDRFLQITLLLWLLAFYLIIYYPNFSFFLKVPG